MKGWVAILAALLALAPGAALAHGGAHPEPWQVWNLDLLLLGGLGLSVLFYGRGVARVWRRAGPGRGVRPWQVWAFAGGMLSLFAALVSPLEAMAEGYFSAHMVQHLVLMLGAAPLLVLSRPLAAIAWGFGRGGALLRVVGRLPARLPLPVAWAAFAGATWLWHLPALYEAALRSPAIHALEHACFVGGAVLFWSVVLHPPAQRGLGYGASVLAVFTIAIQGGLLSALLVFAPLPLYPAYTAGTVIWQVLHPTGANADGVFVCQVVDQAAIDAALLADQQLAGALMWAPASLIYVGVLAGLVLRWLASVERGDALRAVKDRPI